MGIFKRLFSIGKAEAHNAIDKLEDPIKMTEQGIREMKVDLDKALKALAEVKAMAIRSRNEVETLKKKTADYEQKAMLLLQRAQNGQMDVAEADRLATSALAQKDQSAQSLQSAIKTQKTYEAQVSKLEVSVRKLKSDISKWENEAKTLKARAKVSKATSNVNKQLASIDSSSTVSMLERMREKVEKQEALSEAYADMADDNKSVDEELDSALSNTSTSDSLAALKAKMGMLNQDNTNNNTTPPPSV